MIFLDAQVIIKYMVITKMDYNLTKYSCTIYVIFFRGGVYTTASAFRHTTLIDRLQKHNVKFEILEQGNL